MTLKYAVLHGSTLTLYEDIASADENSTPMGSEKEEYVLQRKYGLVEEDHERMQFIVQVQDCAKKYRYKKLMLGVPKAVNQKLTA